MNPNFEQKLEAYISQQMQARHIPGLSLAVIKDSTTWVEQSYGLANLELSVPATSDTVYEIASMTKGFTAAAIISDYGTAFAGPSALIRYNFVRPEARLVPYLQGGVGFIINDAYLDRTQRAIGEAFEFYLHIEMGARYFVAPNWSVDIEGGLQHISNGTLAPRNLGANSLGVTVGFTYYFPSGGR